MFKDEVNSILDYMTRVFDELKKSIFSEELLRVDDSYCRYKSDEMDFKGYVNFLGLESKMQDIDLQGFFNIFLLRQVIAMEDDIDFKKADIERHKLIDEMSKRLSRNEQKVLAEKSIAFKNKMIPQNEYYSYLIKKSRSLEIEESRFPQFHKYICLCLHL